MATFAVLIDGTFKEMRDFPSRPSPIPHKQAVWYPVVRETGEEFDGLVGDNWVVRRPAPPPPRTAGREEVPVLDLNEIILDFAMLTSAIIVLGGNRTLGAPINARPGLTGTVRITQDFAGNRNLLYHPNWKFSGPRPTLSAAPNAIDLLIYRVVTPDFIFAELKKGVS